MFFIYDYHYFLDFIQACIRILNRIRIRIRTQDTDTDTVIRIQKIFLLIFNQKCWLTIKNSFYKKNFFSIEILKCIRIRIRIQNTDTDTDTLKNKNILINQKNYLNFSENHKICLFMQKYIKICQIFYGY